jgi:acetyl esterase/lipase
VRVNAARDSRAVLNDPPPPAAPERIVYGPKPLQFGDWREPHADGSSPLVILLHGGAWKSTFNLIHLGHMAIALTAEGYRTFNVEFRRVGDPGGGWRGSFEDVLAAVDYILDRPDVDRDRVVLAGHSAGGHLALLAASERKLPVIAMAAGSDLEAWQSDAALAFLGDPSKGAEASPRNRIPLGVRQIFIHGSDDDQVPAWLSAAFVAAARSAGDEAELVELEGAGHFDMIDPQSAHWSRLVDCVRSILG